MKKRLIYILLIVLAYTSQAQNWVGVDTSFTRHDGVTFMYVDTVEDRLYLGGDFTDSAAKMRSGLLYYDGYQIHNPDTFHPPQIGTGYSLSMTRYQNKMYVGGTFSQIGKKNITSHSIVQLQGDTFISVNPGPTSLYGARIQSMVEYKGDLILGYEGDSLAGIRSKGIVRFDGSKFLPMGGGVLHDRPDAIVYSLAVYKNKLYVGGNFSDTTSNGKTADKTRSFQVWDDSRSVWTIIDGWKGGFNATVTDMVEFRGDLYILGSLNTFDGSIAEDIIRFDGTYFYAVGNGAGVYSIDKAVVHKNELYVCGYFRGLDGVQAYGVAKWNGIRWCSLSNDVFTRASQFFGVQDIAFYRDTLYAIGGFLKISGQDIKVLAKWVGDSSMTGGCAPAANQDTVNFNLSVLPQNQGNPSFRIFPNPSNGAVTIETNEFVGSKQVQLIDQAGKVLIWGKVNSTNSEMDLKGLEPGIYFLRIENMGARKIVKN